LAKLKKSAGVLGKSSDFMRCSFRQKKPEA